MSTKDYVITILVTRESLLDRFETDGSNHNKLSVLAEKYNGTYNFEIGITGLTVTANCVFNDQESADMFEQEITTDLMNKGVGTDYTSKSISYEIMKNYS